MAQHAHRIPDSIVGLIASGEMGTALARSLRRQGLRVITSVAGRSASTVQRAKQAGFEMVERLADVGRGCDILLSVVPPAAAREVADEFRQSYRPTWRVRTYLDVNSIAPESMAQIAEDLSAAGLNVVDAAVHGQAARLRDQATMYVSGRHAAAVAELFQSGLRVRVLGERPGRASLMKMLLGSMTKGLIALFLQAGRLADNDNSAAPFAEELRHFYPELCGFLDRSLPTYPQHARRRSEEMGELAMTLASAGLNEGLAREAQQMFREVADCNLGTFASDPERAVVPQLLNELSRRGFWSAPLSDAVEPA